MSARLRNCSGQSGAVKSQRCPNLTYPPGTQWRISQQPLGRPPAGDLPAWPSNDVDFTPMLSLVHTGDAPGTVGRAATAEEPFSWWS